jgi:hypothetical protein
MRFLKKCCAFKLWKGFLIVFGYVYPSDSWIDSSVSWNYWTTGQENRLVSKDVVCMSLTDKKTRQALRCWVLGVGRNFIATRSLLQSLRLALTRSGSLFICRYRTLQSSFYKAFRLRRRNDCSVGTGPIPSNSKTSFTLALSEVC